MNICFIYVVTYTIYFLFGSIYMCQKLCIDQEFLFIKDLNIYSLYLQERFFN